MHHTDYSSNLRNTQHKTLKTLSLKRSMRPESTDRAGSNHELLRAAMAALLVIIVLLQMDPANAQQPQNDHFVPELVDNVLLVVETVNLVTPLYPNATTLTL